jgi:hypothetical protein
MVYPAKDILVGYLELPRWLGLIGPSRRFAPIESPRGFVPIRSASRLGCIRQDCRETASLTFTYSH